MLLGLRSLVETPGTVLACPTPVAMNLAGTTPTLQSVLAVPVATITTAKPAPTLTISLGCPVPVVIVAVEPAPTRDMGLNVPSAVNITTTEPNPVLNISLYCVAPVMLATTTYAPTLAISLAVPITTIFTGNIVATNEPFSGSQLSVLGTNIVASAYASSIVQRGYNQTGSRTNLIPYSQQIQNAAWTSDPGIASIAANATTAPDGTTTAAALVEDSASSSKIIYAPSVTFTAQTYTWSIYAKAGTRSWLGMTLDYTGHIAYFNLSTGVLGSVTSGSTASIISVGNGWYRCTITMTMTTGAGYCQFFPTTANGVGQVYVGAGGTAIYAWGGQVEVGSVPTPYIPTSSTVVTVPDPGWQGTARTNLALYSSFYNNATWALSQATLASGFTAPDGTSTAWTLTDNAVNTEHFIRQSFTTPPAATYKARARLKAGTHQYGSLQINCNGTWAASRLDLVNGVVLSGPATLSPLGSGWYLCEISAAYGGSGACQVVIETSSSGGGSYVGTGEYIYVWGAEFGLANEMVGPYIPTTNAAATVYEQALSPSARTNYAAYSGDASQTSWWGRHGSVSVTTGVTDVIGGTAAATITAVAANDSLTTSVGSSGMVAGNTYTGSIWIRRRTGTGTIKILDPGYTTWTTVPVTSTWTRFSVTGITTNTYGFTGVLISTIGDQVDVCFPQLEDGFVAGAYIPTPTWAKVTLTDATISNSGAVTLGQAASGSYFWSGTGSVPNFLSIGLGCPTPVSIVTATPQSSLSIAAQVTSATNIVSATYAPTLDVTGSGTNLVCPIPVTVTTATPVPSIQIDLAAPIPTAITTTKPAPALMQGLFALAASLVISTFVPARATSLDYPTPTTVTTAKPAPAIQISLACPTPTAVTTSTPAPSLLQGLVLACPTPVAITTASVAPTGQFGVACPAPTAAVTASPAPTLNQNIVLNCPTPVAITTAKPVPSLVQGLALFCPTPAVITTSSVAPTLTQNLQAPTPVSIILFGQVASRGVLQPLLCPTPTALSLGLPVPSRQSSIYPVAPGVISTGTPGPTLALVLRQPVATISFGAPLPSIVVSTPLTPNADTTYYVNPENRTHIMIAEIRSTSQIVENRVGVVQSENRVYLVPVENRVCTVRRAT